MGTYEEYKKILKSKTGEQLIEAFNREVGNPGWASSRASYLAALHDEFEEHRYDYAEIGDKYELSLARKVKLVGKKIRADKSKASGRGGGIIRLR